MQIPAMFVYVSGYAPFHTRLVSQLSEFAFFVRSTSVAALFVLEECDMKKFLAVLLMVTMVLSLVACGGNNTVQTDSSTPTISNSETTSGNESSKNSSTTDSSVSEESSKIESSTPVESSKPTESSKPVESEASSKVESSKPITSSKQSSSSSSSSQISSSKPTHTHKFTLPTCTEPGKCSCGATGASALGHDYKEATCIQAKKCVRCSMTTGKSLGHDYKSATCTEPKKCTRCSQTLGTALGHDFTEATCTEAKTCIRCSTSDGVKLGHNFENGVCKNCEALDPDYIQYTITYNSNDGWGETESSSHIYNESRALSKNRFKRAGYTFVGWNTDKNAITPKYTDTQKVKNLSSTNGDIVVLYAVWKEAKTSTFDELMPLEDSRDNIKYNQTAIDNAGKTHNNVMVLSYGAYKRDPSESERFTSGTFKKIKGTLIPVSSDLMTEGSSTGIYIYADGVKIYESIEMNKYSSPVNFEVDISGVNAIRIRIFDHNGIMSWNNCGELMIENLVLER